MALRKKGIASMLMGACVLMSSMSGLGMQAFAAGADGNGADQGVGLNIPVTKVIMGREWNAKDKYEFTLSAIGEVEGMTLPTKTTLEINEKSANHTAKFEAVTFAKEAKGALLQVAEKDGDTWVLSVDAKADKEGNMGVTYTVGSYDEETKKFTAGKGAKTILSVTTDKADAETGSVLVNWPVMISMEGRDFNTKDNFGLKFNSPNETNPMPGADSRQLALGEKNLAYLVVGPIAYTEPGTYEYTVTQDYENAEDKDTVTYDAAEYKVIVTTEASEDGVLSATTKITNKAGAEVDMMSFVNKYAKPIDDTKPGDDDKKPGDDTKPGDETKPGDDDKKPGDGDKDPEKKDITGLKAVIESATNPITDAWMDSVRTEITKLGITDKSTIAAIDAVDKARDDVAAINTVLGKLSGQYVTLGGKADELKMPNIEAPVQAVVDLKAIENAVRNPKSPDAETWLKGIEGIAEAGKIEDGELTTMIADVRANPDDNEAVTRLINKLIVLYKDNGGTEDLIAATKAEPIAIALKGTVELTGRDWIEGDSFEFELAAANEETAKAVEDGKVVLPDVTKFSVTNASEDHSFSLGSIQFTEASPEAGYTFKVNQTNGGANGLSEGMSYDINVVVTEKEGKLEYACTVAGDVFNPEDASLKFDIKYAAAELKWKPSAVFELEGRKYTKDEAFILSIKGMDEASIEVMKNSGYGQRDECGTVFTALENESKFAAEMAEMKFTKAGKYTYQISQGIPADNAKIADVTYDTSVYTLTLDVQDDNKGGLSVKPVFTDKDGKELENGVTFKNVYKKASTDNKTDNKTNTSTTDDKKKSNKVTPQTGVQNNSLVGVAIGGGIAVIAGAGAGLYYLNKKRNEEDEENDSDDI